MITYKWNCKTVDVYPQANGETDVVYNVHWVLTGVSDTYVASNFGTQIVELDSEKEFIPFDELTNDIIVEWTKEAMGEDEVSAIEQGVSNQVSELENPTSVTLTIEK
jgi:hypothetical protein